MELQILAFGIMKDIIGSTIIRYPIQEPITVAQLLTRLHTDYPKSKQLVRLLVAVNNEYASEDMVLTANDEIALIPPVSGG